MKTLMSIILVLVTLPLFSQVSFKDSVFFELKKQNLISSKTKLDTISTKYLLDIIKDYMVEKQDVILPKNCVNDSNIISLDEIIGCADGKSIKDYIFFAKPFMTKEIKDKNELIKKFVSEFEKDFFESILFYEKINIDLFNIQTNVSTTFFDPNTLSTFEEITNQEIYVFIYIIYL